MHDYLPSRQKVGPTRSCLLFLFVIGISLNCNHQPDLDLISTLNHAWGEKRTVVDARLSDLPVGRKSRFGVYHEGLIFDAPYRTLYLHFDSLLGLDFYVLDIPQDSGLEARLKDSVTRSLGTSPKDSILGNGVRVSIWASKYSLCESRAGQRTIFLTGRPRR